jgi:drug/metabolite transporter (DMT)-like permease
MSQVSILASAPFLIILTAVGYTVATIGMKLVSEDIVVTGFGVLSLGLVAAIIAEVALLRKTDLSVVYITIVASETLLVLIYASVIGEGFSIKQFGGAALVMVGLVVVTT